MALFFKQATLSHNGKSTVSNITTGEIIEAVTATKKAVIPTYNSDSTITYIIIPPILLEQSTISFHQHSKQQ